MEQTYVEVKGKKPFNWNEFLNKKEYTVNELFMAMDKAKSWTTCACGNQCSIIPRRADGSPKDHSLTKLGSRFYINIGNMAHARSFAITEKVEENRLLAVKTLRSIERRSAKLIKEIAGN